MMVKRCAGFVSPLSRVLLLRRIILGSCMKLGEVCQRITLKRRVGIGKPRTRVMLMRNRHLSVSLSGRWNMTSPVIINHTPQLNRLL